jgi:hypothetical protein
MLKIEKSPVSVEEIGYEHRARRRSWRAVLWERVRSILCLIAGLGLLATTAAAQTNHAPGNSSDEELVKQLANPVASLISVPFQNNWDFGLGGGDGWRYTLNFQPVVPIKLNEDWNLIIRTIVPFVHQEEIFKGVFDQLDLPEGIVEKFTGKFGDSQTGLGDITQSFFLSPSKGPFGFVVGAGPVFLYPSATNELLGTGKWGSGPTVVILKQVGGWSIGALINHIWSFAGEEKRSYVSTTFLQPFLSYATKTKTTFTINAESTYDWNAGQWTIPVNFSVSQLIRVGKLPVSVAIGARYYAEAPRFGPSWGMRFVVTPLFPTGNR